jgi:branched-chain amino acid transport system substrate-binding protein
LSVTELDTYAGRAQRLIETANRAAEAVPAAQRVRIGILTPLTEPGFPVAGELMARGAVLGAEYVREFDLADGRQFEFVLQDDQADAAAEGMGRSAVGAMAKLAVFDRVAAVIGQWHLRTTPWAVEVAERFGVPIFVENGHDAITAQHNRTVFRSYFSIADRVPLMMDFIAAQGACRVAAIAPDTVFGAMLSDAVEAAGRAHGMEMLRLDYPQLTTQNFRPELEKIAAFEPDWIVNLGVMAKPTAVDIMREAAEMGLRPRIPMMLSFSFPNASDAFWQATGDAGEGIVWPALEFRSTWPGLTQYGRWLIDRYRAEYGAFPPDPILNAFTDVTIIAQAIAHAGSAEREAILTALEAKPFDTWRGPVAFERRADHWHHSPPPVQLLQYQKVGQTFEEAAIVHPPELKSADYQPARSAAPR